MTTTSRPLCRSAARCSRWSQARHGGARSNQPRRPKMPYQSSSLDVDRYLTEAPVIRTHINHRRNQSRCPHPKSSPAAIKDAMRRTKAASVFLHSPSSHRDVRRLANG